MEKGDIRVTITSGTIAKTIMFLLILVVLFIVRDLVIVVLTAIVIASAVEPATKWFMKYRISRLPSVVSVYVVVGLIATGLFYLMVPPLISDTVSFLNRLPTYIDSVKIWNPIQNEDKLLSTTEQVKNFSSQFSFSEITNTVKSVVSNASDGFFKVASLVFGGAFSFILIVVLSFYFAAQEEGVKNFLKVVTPINKQKYILDLWRRSQIKIGLWMQGQVLLAVIIGVLVYLGLTILGVNNALLLAILAGVFEIIPVFGPILAAIPAILVGVFDGGGLTTGLLITGLYVIIQQFENHLIYPLVVQKIVGVSPIIVILAFVIGAKLAGFLGIILAVPVASALMEYFNDVQRTKVIPEEQASNV